MTVLPVLIRSCTTEGAFSEDRIRLDVRGTSVPKDFLLVVGGVEEDWFSIVILRFLGAGSVDV